MDGGFLQEEAMQKVAELAVHERTSQDTEVKSLE